MKKRFDIELYKSGEKNKYGYRKSIKLFKFPIILSIIVSFLILCSVITVLDKTNVISWNKIQSYVGAVNSVSNHNSDFSVHYLNVGQSDCSIVVCDNKVLMIDTSLKANINEVREALISLNIDTIDYMIITHQHDDHMGGASTIINNFNVKNVIMPKLSKINMVTTYAYEELLTSIKDKKVNPIPATSGLEFFLGSSKVKILSPTVQDENLNNMSVVIKLTYGNNSFLFTGDAEKSVEKQLLNSGVDIKADVLKLGHHGSNTSSTDSFLNTVKPRYAVISCGSDNSYGHPSKDVIERLHKNNIPYYITNYHGNITFTSDGNNINVTTETSG